MGPPTSPVACPDPVSVPLLSYKHYCPCLPCASQRSLSPTVQVNTVPFLRGDPMTTCVLLTPTHQCLPKSTSPHPLCHPSLPPPCPPPRPYLLSPRTEPSFSAQAVRGQQQPTRAASTSLKQGTAVNSAAAVPPSLTLAVVWTTLLMCSGWKEQ